jgi:outer membrane protein assembly factor BamB
MIFRALFAVVIAAFICPSVRADDWPQWLGPKRDSEWRETGIVPTFPSGGLKILWRTPVAGGYAGPSVANGRVYVTDFVSPAGTGTNSPGARDKLEGKERLICFDAASGKELWKKEYDCTYNISYACGPRVTPTVADGKVYALGAEGNLLCCDAETGSIVWSKELKKEYKVETPIWGFCGHPLVDGKTLYCLVGGEGSVAVAFDKDTGRELWKALSANEPGYCPPTMIEAGGTKQLLIWHPESLNSLDPKTGRSYWSCPLVPSFGMSICAPRVHGDLLFASAIRETGVVLKLHQDKPGYDEVWREKSKTGVPCANSTPFIENGIIFGNDCNSGHVRGVKLATGERLWETLQPTTGSRATSHGTAFLVKNGDRFFLLNEHGELIIAKLSAAGYEEISRTKLLEPTGTAFGRNVVWSHPAFANKCIFARNDKEIVCASLAGE